MRVLSPNRLVVTSCAVLALGLGACASSGTTGSTGGGAGDPDHLTEQQLQTVPELNALEAIRRLRPGWLRARGMARSTPNVYVNGMRQGNIDELSSLRASDVLEMEYLTAAEATNRFGTNNTGGAIVVTTRR